MSTWPCQSCSDISRPLVELACQEWRHLAWMSLRLVDSTSSLLGRASRLASRQKSWIWKKTGFGAWLSRNWSNWPTSGWSLGWFSGVTGDLHVTPRWPEQSWNTCPGLGCSCSRPWPRRRGCRHRRLPRRQRKMNAGPRSGSELGCKELVGLSQSLWSPQRPRPLDRSNWLRFLVSNEIQSEAEIELDIRGKLMQLKLTFESSSSVSPKVPIWLTTAAKSRVRRMRKNRSGNKIGVNRMDLIHFHLEISKRWEKGSASSSSDPEYSSTIGSGGVSMSMVISLFWSMLVCTELSLLRLAIVILTLHWQSDSLEKRTKWFETGFVLSNLLCQPIQPQSLLFLVSFITILLLYRWSDKSVAYLLRIWKVTLQRCVIICFDRLEQTSLTDKALQRGASTEPEFKTTSLAWVGAAALTSPHFKGGVIRGHSAIYEWVSVWPCLRQFRLYRICLLD